MATLNIKNIQVEKLKPYDRNARTHSEKQIEQIAASIKQFGFNNPVLIDKDCCIIAGHGRVMAAQKLGLKDVPTIRLDHMSDDEKRAYILADNRLAEKAGWDQNILALELQHLLEVPDLDFDVELTGFETPEIDLMIDGLNEPEADPDDQIPEPEEVAVSKPGDLWKLGDHLLYCGDSLKAESYDILMQGDKATLCFADPPYNVPIDGHVGNSGKTKHREFAMASGEMSVDEFTEFLKTVFGHAIEHSVDGSIHYQCMDWRHIGEIETARKLAGYDLKNICTWVKDNGGMGSFYRSRHEFIFVFKNGTAPHINNVQLGTYGRYRTNVWEYAGVNSFGNGRMGELKLHPTVKPVALVSDAIKDASKRGDIVLDNFGGSGSTLIAAERTGRCARLIEIDPIYCDVIIRRWQDLTGEDAIHTQSEHTFNKLKDNVGDANDQ